jgi:hypothetical protein
MRNIRNAQKILFGQPGGRDYFAGPGTDFTIVSRYFKGTGSEGMNWIHLGEKREKWLVLLCLVESLGFI